MPEMMEKMPMDGAMNGEMGEEEMMAPAAVVEMKFFPDGTYEIAEIPPEGESNEEGEAMGGEEMPEMPPMMAKDWKQAMSMLAKINEKASGGNAQEAFDNPDGAKPVMMQKKGLM